MKLPAFLSLLALVLLEAGTASRPKGRKRRDQTNEEGDSYAVLNLGNYVPGLDNYDEVIDLSDYEGLMDYVDQLPEVRGTQQTNCIPWAWTSPSCPQCRGSSLHLSPGSGNSSPSIGTYYLDNTKEEDNRSSVSLLVCNKLDGIPHRSHTSGACWQIRPQAVSHWVGVSKVFIFLLEKEAPNPICSSAVF